VQIEEGGVGLGVRGRESWSERAIRGENIVEAMALSLGGKERPMELALAQLEETIIRS
jgi:hypothetical protein